MLKIKHNHSSNSISIKLLLPYALLLLIILITLVIHFQILKLQDSDSVRINLAGRQRMLTQKMSKEALLYSQDITAKKDLEKTISIFDSTLNALTNGGKAPLDLNLEKHIELPAMENESTKLQLSIVNNLWREFKTNMDLYIDTKDPAALNYIAIKNTPILNEIDKAVYMMQNTGEKNNRNINLLLYLAYISITLVLAILLGKKLYQLKKASTYINSLETILPICANCKKIREPNTAPEEQKSWTAIETYVEKRSESQFSHGLCPECQEELYGEKEWFKRRRQDKNK